MRQFSPGTSLLHGPGRHALPSERLRKGRTTCSVLGATARRQRASASERGTHTFPSPVGAGAQPQLLPRRYRKPAVLAAGWRFLGWALKLQAAAAEHVSRPSWVQRFSGRSTKWRPPSQRQQQKWLAPRTSSTSCSRQRGTWCQRRMRARHAGGSQTFHVRDRCFRNVRPFCTGPTASAWLTSVNRFRSRRWRASFRISGAAPQSLS